MSYRATEQLVKKPTSGRPITVGWNDVRVREFRAHDFTWELVGADAPYRHRLSDLSANPSVIPAVTVEYLGRAIGIHFLDRMVSGDAEFWAHFLSPDSRGKGIGAISWFKACQHFFDSLDSLQNLLFRVPKGNPYASRLVKKLPLRFSHGDSLYDIYAISRDEFARLRGEDNAGDDLDDEMDDAD